MPFVTGFGHVRLLTKFDQTETKGTRKLHSHLRSKSTWKKNSKGPEKDFTKEN